MRLRHVTNFLLPLFIAASLLSSCRDLKFWENEAAPPAKKDPFNAAQLLDIRKRAATIQTQLDRMPRQDFSFTVGDTMITAVLYGEPGNPLQVDERWADRNGNSGRNRFYFDKGTLFHLYARSSINLNPLGDASDRAETLYRLYFNDNGNMFHYEKLMGGSDIELGVEEMPAFMRRAEALRRLIPSDSAGTFDTSVVIAILHGDESTLPAPAASVAEDAPVPDAPTGGDNSAAMADQPPSATQKSPHAENAAGAQKQKPVVPEQRPAATKKVDPPKQPVVATQKAPTDLARQSSPPKQTTATRQSTQPSTAQDAATPRQSVPTRPLSQNSGLVRKPVPPLPDEDADAVIPVHTHRMIPGPLNSSRVRFQKGSTGITLSASLEKGRHNEYVLRARRGQTMQVTLDTEQQDVAFRVFLDNSDISGERRSWSGTLPRYADYHIVVYLKKNSASQSTGYTITIGIP